VILKVDNEGRQVIQWLCDIALKAQGVQALQNVLNVFNNTKELKDGNPGDGTYPRLVSEESGGEDGGSELPD
jgi:hypothetical protein